MNKKRLLIYLVIAVVFAISLVVKVQMIKESSKEEKVTISSIWAKEGRPVYTTLVKREKMPLFSKTTTKIIGKRELVGYLPSNLISYVSKKQIFDLEIDNKEYSVIVRSIGSASENYSGFVAVRAHSTKDLPYEKGALVIARSPYNGKKNTLTVPLDAIYFDGKDQKIYVVVDNKVQIRTVKVAAKNHKRAVITGNVKKGDIVVVSDQRDLVEGEFVASVAK